MQIKRYVFYLFAITLFTVGCESVNDFRTVASVQSQLSGSWSMVQIPANSPAETWTFSAGSITRIIYAYNGSIEKEEHGTYSVTTTFTTPYVTIDNVNGGSYICAKWTIITLDNSTLMMTQNGGGSVGTGLLQKEFVKK